jgi:hypothetical protein
MHRVDRVLGFFSSRRIWDPPSLTGECSPHLVPGGIHSLAGELVGGPNSDVGSYTVVLYRYMYFVVRQSWAIGVYTVQTQTSELMNQQECSPYCTVLYTHILVYFQQPLRQGPHSLSS